MPDIPVAAMVLYFTILLVPVDEASGWQVAAIGAIGIFAVLSHYANPPLALALACAVLGWRVIVRRITWRVVAMAVTPVLAAPAVNFAVNVATDTGPSIAPKRLPLVLARSVADGPSKWYRYWQADDAGSGSAGLAESRRRSSARTGPGRGAEQSTPGDIGRRNAASVPIPTARGGLR